MTEGAKENKDSKGVVVELEVKGNIHIEYKRITNVKERGEDEVAFNNKLLFMFQGGSCTGIFTLALGAAVPVWGGVLRCGGECCGGGERKRSRLNFSDCSGLRKLAYYGKKKSE